MSSLLLATADPSAAHRITKIADDLSIYVRVVTSVDSAREWLSMETFGAFIIDDRYGHTIPLDTITLAWRYHPITICGVFNFVNPVGNEWGARLIGATVAHGENAEFEIRKLLGSIPKNTELVDGAKILVVEDLDSPRYIISSYVESLNLGAVHGASGGEQALSILQTDADNFFCVITDLKMPKMSGIELIYKIRDEKAPNKTMISLPVIVLTSIATLENLIDSVRAGASGFIVKPPKKQTLQAELEKAQRIVLSGQSPMLCKPTDAENLEDVIASLGFPLG